ncbi:unnamed protein product [Thelazia callipaeda]|uniref:GLOBIN domain-containing protein n=1 Tax=Thelazia callipaeda TaxID=103827 RepID=A0A0N5D8Y9_THECL|nr:unnamed protein product [Thelazia callipaeda]
MSSDSTGIITNTSRQSTKLTAYQYQVLRMSWKALRPSIKTLMRRILTDLENEVPGVKQIFHKTAVLDAFHREDISENLGGTFEEHIKIMVGFFDDIIENMQNEESVSKRIKEIGQIHVLLTHSLFSADIWEKLGEITMQYFSSQDAVQKTREAGKAWRTLIAWITDDLRCGFENKARIYHSLIKD